KKWFPTHKIQDTVAHGARQIRALGRLSVFSNINTVLDSIREAIRRINDKRLLSGGEILRTSDNVPVNVFIVSSVCGGTGSGMVTDLPYIIRQLVASEAMLSPEIHGYLFMPDALVDIADSELERIKANGAAALKEIDLFMENMEKFSTRYSDDFHIGENIGMMKPYDFCYLVSGVDITDQHTIEKVVSEQVFHGFGTDLTKDSKSYLANVPTNAFKAIPSGEFVGKKTNYSTIGVSSCIIPVKKIIDIFSNKFSSGLMDAILEYANPKDEKTENPWQRDVLLFARNNGFEVDMKGELKLLDKIMEVNKAVKLVASKYTELTVNNMGDILLQDQTTAEKSYAEVKKSVEDVKAKLVTDLVKNYVSLVTESMGDADRGVRFIVKTSEHLLNMLEQFREQLVKERDVKRKEMQRFIQLVREKKQFIEDEIQKSWFMRSKRAMREAAEEWANNNNNAFVAQLQIDRRENAIEVLDQLMGNINSNIKKLQGFNKIVESLENKFHKNSTFTGTSLDEFESDWLLNNSIVAGEDLERLYKSHVGNPGGYETLFIGKNGLNISEKWPFYTENSVLFEEDVKNYSSKLLEEKLKDLSIEEFLTEKSKITGEDEIRKVGESLAQKGKP
ncbi:MAG TPA: tubulin-like doman-containing protein, partial [Candidatus Wallbacteria bacterium]|nr:tubulin-like doman-containing protein [Candidatus Wallbacteria bacterium]